MTEPLSLARFRDLSDAYGGVVARWPEAHRDAAMALAAMPEALEILAQASKLDETLDAWRVPSSSDSLRERALAGAPVPRRGFGTRARLWWSGIGIAAALTGAVAGAATVAVVAPVEASPDSGTSFGDISAQEG